MGAFVNNVNSKQWVFYAMNRKNKCTIEANAVVFDIQQYVGFTKVKEAIANTIDSIMSKFEDSQGKRFGLRYINKLLLDNDKWINENFYDAIAAHKDEKTTKLTTTLEYTKSEEDINVRLLYGYENPDYPSIIKRNEFTIDIDAYTQGLIYRDDITKYLNCMHDEVVSCFETMITDDYRLFIK